MFLSELCRSHVISLILPRYSVTALVSGGCLSTFLAQHCISKNISEISEYKRNNINLYTGYIDFYVRQYVGNCLAFLHY